MNLILLAALTGCAPDDANVKGDWFAWLATQSSATVDEGNLSFDDATVFECSGRGWNAETCDFDNGYIGPKGKAMLRGLDKMVRQTSVLAPSLRNLPPNPDRPATGPHAILSKDKQQADGRIECGMQIRYVGTVGVRVRPGF